MKVPGNDIKQRVNSLEQHLQKENPLLVDAVKGFRQLDQVAHRLGLLARHESYVTHIPWWPLISVLGTYSAGKSTFINRYADQEVQETGNQAVDDKFTVLCYSGDDQVRVLPGVALDVDPRFPFFQISQELEKVEKGEGNRVDAYLQLKTCHSEVLRGNIIIDSPGFDADAQRTSTLRLTDHIINLSDLVLVFFDARHPEVGTMQDTLKHLVGNTINRHDSSKFIYILNQIDTASKEDNPEDVIASWQRALAQHGLTAGRFFAIYDQDASLETSDEQIRKRFERKRDEDLAEIHQRMKRVHIERAYRIIDTLERTARDIEDHYVPRLQNLISKWVTGVAWRDALLLVLSIGLFSSYSAWAGYWQGFEFTAPWASLLATSLRTQVIVAATLFGFILGLHHISRSWSARSVIRTITKDPQHETLMRAFLKNTRARHSIFRPSPVGWGSNARRSVRQVLENAGKYVQQLNNRFTNPSGGVKTNADKNRQSLSGDTDKNVTVS